MARGWHPERHLDDAFEAVKDWRLILVGSGYAIHSPAFVHASKQRVELSAEELVSPAKLRLAFLKQAREVFPASVASTWDMEFGPLKWLLQNAQPESPEAAE